MKNKYFCKKRNEQLPPFDKMPQDYCIDCKHYDILQDCFACGLDVAYIDNANSNVIAMPNKFTTVQTAFGAYTVDRKDKPLRAFFKDGQELDLSNLNVIIHDNGIEFV